MITKDMIISEVLRMKEGAAEILMSSGMGCLGCPSSQMETLEEAAGIHGLNIDTLLIKLNQ